MLTLLFGFVAAEDDNLMREAAARELLETVQGLGRQSGRTADQDAFNINLSNGWAVGFGGLPNAL